MDPLISLLSGSFRCSHEGLKQIRTTGQNGPLQDKDRSAKRISSASHHTRTQNNGDCTLQILEPLTVRNWPQLAKPRTVAISVGLMNLASGWFGAMPMCHGAGVKPGNIDSEPGVAPVAMWKPELEEIAAPQR